MELKQKRRVKIGGASNSSSSSSELNGASEEQTNYNRRFWILMPKKITKDSGVVNDFEMVILVGWE